eukprot:Nitzschia sp. Nitz4//scaffold3_size479765//43810//46457//NITZ4_000017-RA/size479765-augustus-gene-0.1-mRNA-1//1//CDS//3329550509//5964//frame0
MNICGGIAPITEPEQLLLEIPDEKFQMTPRRKASSSAPSRRDKVPSFVDTGRKTPTEHRPSSSRHSSARRRSHEPQSPIAAPSPTFLNPISKDELKKSRSRQRSSAPPLHSSKGNTIKRNDSSFKVNLVGADGSRKMALLDVNSEKVYLRVRPREENSSDHENDGSNSNFSEIRLKVAEITRLEIRREKASRKSSSSPKPMKNFTIVMKRNVGETNVFTFETESTLERDTAVGNIKTILELAKGAVDSRRRSKTPSASGVEDGKVQRKSRSSERDTSHGTKREKSATPINASRRGKDETPGKFFDFDIPEETALQEQCETRDTIPSQAKIPEERAPDVEDSAKPTETKALALSVPDDSHLKNVAMEVAGSGWGFDDMLCGMTLGQTVTTPKSEELEGPDSEGENENNALGQTQGWNPLLGCNTQALATVEDVELAAMAANEVASGPFCTDDVCTTSLKDFTDTMKSIFEMKQNSREGKPAAEKQRAMTEDYITNVLGAPTSVSNLLSVKDMWGTKIENPKPFKKVLRNRSRCTGGQASRVASLRRQMTFKSLHSVEHMPFVQVVHSYDDMERSGRFGQKLNSSDIQKAPRNDTSQFLRKVTENAIHDEVDEEGEVLYYDSDPEDVRERAATRGPRRAVADRNNLSPRAKPHTEALSSIPMSRMNLSRRLRRCDDDLVTDIIDTMKNEQMTLMWHPAQSESIPNRAPFCVKVWIESGIYLIDGTFLLPKLTWVPLFEESLRSKVLNVTLSNPGAIDLLDVCRVRECNRIDRNIHPFAKVDCSFIVQTQKETQIFEAQSREERKRIVNGLRLVIARLASLLMLRDLRAVDEFFGGNSVPGEAPSWAKGKNEKPSQPNAMP